MTTFFTADTHFGDHRTVNIQRRPFASVADMDEAWEMVFAIGAVQTSRSNCQLDAR